MEKKKVILQINSGILTRRIPMSSELFEQIIRGGEFRVPVKKMLNLGSIRALSDALTSGMSSGIPIMIFKFNGKTEGSDHCPILELYSFNE